MTSRFPKLEEPGLSFRYSQTITDPHDGLSLFGPYDTDMPSHPRNLTYALIGTEPGISAFALFSEALGRAQYIRSEDTGKRRLWPVYPGFEAVFHCAWPSIPATTASIAEKELLEHSRHRDPSKRAYMVVSAYLDKIRILSRRDEHFDFFVCVVPEEIWQNCRPLSHPTDAIGSNISRKERQMRSLGQLSLVDNSGSEYRMSTDFRRQIKARSMEFRVPIQIVRASTLRVDNDSSEQRRGLTCLSDRAWNLSTALYYKAGGKPWRLATAREGVSYVGLAFRRADTSIRGRTAVCAAQMFIDSGDGIVFLGEYGPWYSPQDNSFHLNRKSAESLLKGVISTYRDMDGRPLNEIFLHSRSEISTDEFRGYVAACPEGVKAIGIRVRPDWNGVRLFREGTRPVVRGTFLPINKSTGFLWTSGFKPEIGTYDGWEVPVPLRIDIQHGSADIEQVGRDILGLTKLNYNACKLGSSLPVTVGFSNAVGEILVSNPAIKQYLPQFKYYI